jgi:4a-hydroxytetrahydrobiopterin dehydratase
MNAPEWAGDVPTRRAGRSLIFQPGVPPSMAELLSDDEIESQLPDGWAHEGDRIVRTYEFDSYLEGVGFAAGAGGLAEEAFHHPTLTVEWQEVTVELTSHEEGGVTTKDIDLAERLDELAD